MSYKLLLALAACLPLALSGCGGGGGTPASATQTPGGTQTPAAALEAAKNAVSNANSAKTAAAVEAARRALAAAVQTAETAVETAETGTTSAQAAVTKAQDYRTAQMAILDGLQPITAASLSLATVKTASTPAEAAAALTAAENAMTLATETRTAAAIEAARRALAAAARAAQAALEAAQAALEAARAALELAREYRTEQLPAIGSIVITQPEPPPSSPAAEFDVTHFDQSSAFIVSPSGAVSKQQLPILPFDNSYWSTIRDDVRALANGFDLYMRPVSSSNIITEGTPARVARKRFTPEAVPELPGVLAWDDRIIAIGDYSAFDVVRSFTTLSGVPSYGGGTAWAFGEPTNRYYPSSSPSRGFWYGPAVVISAESNGRLPAVLVGRFVGGNTSAGQSYPAEARLIYYPETTTTLPYGGMNLIITLLSGESVFSFEMATINSDGTFSSPTTAARGSDPTGTFKGNFYGPNWEEVAGTFEGSNSYGAWLATAGRDTSVVSISLPPQ